MKINHSRRNTNSAFRRIPKCFTAFKLSKNNLISPKKLKSSTALWKFLNFCITQCYCSSRIEFPNYQENSNKISWKHSTRLTTDETKTKKLDFRFKTNTEFLHSSFGIYPGLRIFMFLEFKNNFQISPTFPGDIILLRQNENVLNCLYSWCFNKITRHQSMNIISILQFLLIGT